MEATAITGAKEQMMSSLRIEHVNVTVSDAARTAELMKRIFGWHVRWSGPARDNGQVIHVGSEKHYLALYSPPEGADDPDQFIKGRPLNHVGIEVADLGEAEAKVAAAGLIPFAHGDYEPGSRYYFLDPDGIEYEVVSYQLGALDRASSP